MTTNEPTVIHFDVQLSEPWEYDSTDSLGKPRRVSSHRNFQLDVITTTAQRAIELALERHPQGKVHVVQRRGTTNLIFDPEIAECLGEPDG